MPKLDPLGMIRAAAQRFSRGGLISALFLTALPRAISTVRSFSTRFRRSGNTQAFAWKSCVSLCEKKTALLGPRRLGPSEFIAHYQKTVRRKSWDSGEGAASEGYGPKENFSFTRGRARRAPAWKADSRRRGFEEILADVKIYRAPSGLGALTRWFVEGVIFFLCLPAHSRPESFKGAAAAIKLWAVKDNRWSGTNIGKHRRNSLKCCL